MKEDQLSTIASRAGLAGKARAENLAAKQRSEITRKAAARWAKNKPNDYYTRA